jgi:hypothetical protein
MTVTIGRREMLAALGGFPVSFFLLHLENSRGRASTKCLKLAPNSACLQNPPSQARRGFASLGTPLDSGDQRQNLVVVGWLLAGHRGQIHEEIGECAAL